jgi:hypothetical protein
MTGRTRNALTDYDGSRLIPYRHERLKPTSDNWYPSFWDSEEEYEFNREIDGCGGYCRVSIGPLDFARTGWRVAAWGNDDFGIDKDFNSFDEAMVLYNFLLDCSIVNHQTCFNQGMTPF